VAHISQANLERKWVYLCEEVFAQDPISPAGSGGGGLRSRDRTPRTREGSVQGQGGAGGSSSSSGGSSDMPASTVSQVSAGAGGRGGQRLTHVGHEYHVDHVEGNTQVPGLGGVAPGLKVGWHQGYRRGGLRAIGGVAPGL